MAQEKFEDLNDTHAHLLEVAKMQFWRQGYHATSLDDIAKKAGQSKGALFHYFPNKAKIAQDVLQAYVGEEIFMPLRLALHNADDAKSGLLGWLQKTYESYTARDYCAGCLLGNMALELSDIKEDIREDVATHFLNWENILVDAFKADGSDKRMSVEARQAARIVISSYQGIMMSVKAHKDKNRAGREFLALTALIESLIPD